MQVTRSQFRRWCAEISRREYLVAAILALIGTYAFFYEYLPPFKRVRLWSDIAGYHYPLQRYAFHSLKEGRIPLWDASIYCGVTFIGNVQAALLYPPSWLMYAAFWRLPNLPFKAYEAFTFAHIWLAWLLAYMWLRDRLRGARSGTSGRIPGILGASVFACTGYILWQTLHPGVLGAMTWMPLGFWGIDQAVDRRDWRPLWKVSLASALSFLAGYPAAWIVNCVIFVVYALAGRRHLKAAAAVCLALAASTVLFMAQLLPALDARSLMLLEPKYGPGAYDLGTLVRSYFLPNWLDFNPNHPMSFEPGCYYLYLGLPALFAIAWAICRHRVRLYVQPIVALAAALLFANPPTFLNRAVESLPALFYTMQPFNFYSAVPPMVALITAIGLNHFLEMRSGRSIPMWLLIGCAAALAIWALRELRIWHSGGLFATGVGSMGHTAVGLLLFSLGLWCVRQTAGPRRILIAVVLLCATGINYQVFGSGRWFNAIKGDVDDEYFPYGIGGIDDDAYRAMEQNRHYRVAPDNFAAPPGNQYRMYGLASPEGFDPFLTTQYRNTILGWVPFQSNREFYTDVQNDRMLQALGVRYVLVRKGAEHDPLLAVSSKFRLIGREDIFCRVYEFLHSRPPFHWDDDRDGTIQPTAWIPERREFLVQSEWPRRFVLVEQFFPGWRATVDGRPATIEKWGGAFQAIPVAAGEHRIQFEFRPMSARIGAIISLLALAALFLVVWMDARGRSQALSPGNPRRGPRTHPDP